MDLILERFKIKVQKSRERILPNTQSKIDTKW